MTISMNILADGIQDFCEFRILGVIICVVHNEHLHVLDSADERFFL